jgi:DinB superfamily
MQYLSHSLINDLYNQSEQVTEKAIREWQQLPVALLNRQPATNAWSAAQCLEHLNGYGLYYLPAIEKAIKAAKQQPSVHFKSGWLGNYFYKLMLPGTNGLPKKKMKAVKKHCPPVQLDAAAVLSDFISQQERLLQLLNLAPSVNLNTVRVPISIAPFIKLKLGDILLFYIAHIQRHVNQAERSVTVSNNSAVIQNR